MAYARQIGEKMIEMIAAAAIFTGLIFMIIGILHGDDYQQDRFEKELSEIKALIKREEINTKNSRDI